MPSRTAAHIQYKNSNGVIVPSVTTVLSILSKPALLEWAYQCGLKGQNYRAVRDSAGGVGTLVHYLIMCKLTNEEPDTDEYSQSEINTASICLMKYFSWEEGRQIIPILIETPFVSEIHNFGGTIDFYGIIDGVRTLLDLKTGKGIYEEHEIQVAAYKVLLEEHDFPVDVTKILRIGKNEGEQPEYRPLLRNDMYFKMFKSCLNIYNIRNGKEIDFDVDN